MSNLTSTLKEIFGFDSFKKGQKEAITKVLAGKSSAAIFPTGSGKSLCYQLPATQLAGLTLVISPLLSLMKDQLDFLSVHNISAARLDSSLERFEYNKVLDDAKSNKIKVLMISVERFKNERFRTHLRQMKISLMVIDEAHCISEWGHNFRPDYLKLPQYQKEFNIPQVLLLTATATKQVITDMQTKFFISPEDVVLTGFYRENLFLQVSPVDIAERNQKLLKSIADEPLSPTIIYVTLQKTAKDVSDFLISNGLKSQHYHAGLKNDEREKIQNQFMDGKLYIIVATIAFGMGIDKKNVRRVVHYDLPKSIENYSQEIGRSGRDGNNSFCEIIANNDNVTVHENFVYGDTPDKASILQLLQQIKNTEEPFWETKLFSLSNDLNIRPLPLKTLLVYLEIEGIIKPKYTYFEEYSFKNINNSNDIIKHFEGERKAFVAALFNNCIVKKTWTYVDIEKILQAYPGDRNRIISALEFFEEKGFLELQSKQAVERFDIHDKNFDVIVLTDKIYQLFIKKEKVEIQRIHNLIDFFESDSCLSKNLANYFGQILDFEKCGHCSHCASGKANMKSTKQLKPLAEFDFNNLTSPFVHSIKDKYSDLNLTKFLCGVTAPVFRKYKIRRLSNFGVLDQYPFAIVREWVSKNI